MAKLQKIFKSPQALATWLDGKPLPSNIMAVVLNETGDDIAQIQTSGNNITNVFTKFVTVGDQDVERLQEELEEANATIATQETTIHDLQQDVEEWHDKWDTCYRELQTANETIATQSATIATLNATITSQASEIQTLTEQLATANATITSLQADLTNYDNQLQAI